MRLSYAEVLPNNPLEAYRRDWRVRVRRQTPEEWLERHATTRDNIHEQWEELRRERVGQGATFEEELARERNGVIEAYLGQLDQMAGRGALRLGLTEEDLGAWWAISNYCPANCPGAFLGLPGLLVGLGTATPVECAEQTLRLLVAERARLERLLSQSFPHYAPDLVRATGH